ncbi:MAG: hypothetical protein R3305_06805 [Gammaproteobacteria bacterium]|nr:hypothetical protein [Gammaproteobacteria bacterium]
MISAQLVPVVAPALLVVESLRRGFASGAIVALLVSGLIALLSLSAGASPATALLLTVPVLVGGAAMGGLLRWSRSLSVAFQFTLIGAVVFVLATYVVIPNPERIGEALLTDVVTMLESFGVTEAGLAQFAATDPVLIVRLMVIALTFSMLVALMLGYWWYSLIDERVRFGAEFRALKLGRVAGIAMMVLVTLNLFLGFEVFSNMAALAVFGFLFQGLAVMHARSRSHQWPRSLLIAVYVAMVTPLISLVVMALSAVGLLDNFFALRAPVEPKD